MKKYEKILADDDDEDDTILSSSLLFFLYEATSFAHPCSSFSIFFVYTYALKIITCVNYPV